VNFPSSFTGDHVLNLTINRGGGCMVGATATVTVSDQLCKLLDCDPLENRTVTIPYTAPHYSHLTKLWDAAPLVVSLDSIKYLVNGSLHAVGATSVATLSGSTYNVGVSFVKVVGYLGSLTDTCEFTVTVKKGCPTSIDDYEGNTYKVTELAGLCWTENIRSTIDCDEQAIPWAKSYDSPEYPASATRDILFGLLYTWYSAVGNADGDDTPPTPNSAGFVQGVCPCGSHLPSRIDEWALIEDPIDYPTEALKSANPAYWLKPGIDKWNWEARGAGKYSGAKDKFINLLGFAGWWAFEDTTTQYAESFFIEYFCADPKEGQTLKTDGLSVRCILDYD
jgi:uncharacterized protein (TIGR02145 family)